MEDLARGNGALEVRIAKDEAEAARHAAARRSAFSALARVALDLLDDDAGFVRSGPNYLLIGAGE